MKIIILGGFLGTGKTTILMQLAKYLIRTSVSNVGTPVVLLENEVSGAGIDDQLLSRSDFTVENIFAGCICCTSTANLCHSIQIIEEKYAPDWLLIEATGMAYPDSIRATILENTPWPAGILAITDAKRWKKVVLAMHNFVFGQLTDADIILINKIDLVDKKTLETVHAGIKDFNTSAQIFTLTALQEQDEIFWQKMISGLLKGMEVR